LYRDGGGGEGVSVGAKQQQQQQQQQQQDTTTTTTATTTTGKPYKVSYEIRPLKGEPLGAEVVGFDFTSEDATHPDSLAILRQAFLDHLVGIERRGGGDKKANKRLAVSLVDIMCYIGVGNSLKLGQFVVGLSVSVCVTSLPRSPWRERERRGHPPPPIM